MHYAILITLAFFSKFKLDKPKCQTETIQVHWWDFTCTSIKSVPSQLWTLHMYYGDAKIIDL